MSPSPPQDFLQELLRDAVRRVDDVADRLNLKIDALDTKMSQDHKDLMLYLSKRMDDIDVQLDDHSMKIQKHEHNFNIATFLVTGGIATAVSWMTWLGSFFQGKTHP